VSRRRGYQLIDSVSFVRKLESVNVNQNAEMVHIETPVLPSNERQIRPLLTDLQHDGERIHVWAEVAKAGTES